MNQIPLISRHRQIVFLLLHAIQTLAFRWTLKRTTLVLWLDQRHALKAFRASVGDVEGHELQPVVKAAVELI